MLMKASFEANSEPEMSSMSSGFLTCDQSVKLWSGLRAPMSQVVFASLELFKVIALAGFSLPFV